MTWKENRGQTKRLPGFHGYDNGPDEFLPVHHRQRVATACLLCRGFFRKKPEPTAQKSCRGYPLEKEGYTVQREYWVRTPKGAKSGRFVDIYGRNAAGEEKMFQIGRVNQDGTPVAREVNAADDIEAAIGIRPGFIPYNAAGEITALPSPTEIPEIPEFDPDVIDIIPPP